MDLIQARYGWTDDVVFDLPYARFCQLQELLFKIREEEILDAFSLQAFNAWLQGAGQRKTYGQFLKHLGLEKKKAKDPSMNKEDTKRIAEANKDNAKRILLLDKRNQQQKEG